MEAGVLPTVICVTPVKNEAWVLERFLRCAELWADRIIVADQGSTDGSREIAGRFGKVQVVENTSGRYDEAGRQRLLMEAARKVPLKEGTDRRLIVALDADEVLTANFAESPEWGTILRQPAGTVICFQWVNVQADFRGGWVPEIDLPLGYVDDGAEVGGSAIHNWRVPVPEPGKRVVCHEIKVLHYQYTDWQRMKSKHRWYQCWEVLNRPEKSRVEIFRQYHHMYAVPEKEKVGLREEWFKGYREAGIDVTSVVKFGGYYWDVQVAEWIAEFGGERFAQVDIWQVDYEKVWREAKGTPPPGSLKDPRTAEQKEVMEWLKRTQATASEPEVKVREAQLKAGGW